MKCAVIVHIGWNDPCYVEANNAKSLLTKLDETYWLRETAIMNYEDETFNSPNGTKLLDWIEDFMNDARMQKFDYLNYLFSDGLSDPLSIKCIAWAEGIKSCKALKERFEREFN